MWIGPALVQHVAAIFEHLIDGGLEGVEEGLGLGGKFGRRLFRAARAATSLGDEGVGQFEKVHPGKELGPVLVRHAKNLTQGVERQVGGKTGHQIASPQGRHDVEQARHFASDAGLQAAQIAGCEIGHVFAAQLKMSRRIHVDHGV